jgi:hypothetical protein
METDIDRTKAAVAAVVAVAVVGGVGYAYITGMGPLEEDPTAGLEEPPETETTYSFGEVPETGGDGGGGQVNEEMDTKGSSETGNAEAEEENDTDGQTDESDTDGDVETNGADDDGDGESVEAEDDTDDDIDDGTDDTDGTEDGTGTVANTEGRQDGETNDGDDGGGGDDTDRGGTGTLQTNTQTTYTGKPFVPELENMEECGETCREATVAMQNAMNVDAENVVVYVRIHAGDSTDPDDVVWAENRNIGTLGAGEVYRETESIDLTPQQANNVREEGGLATVKATVDSRQATATFVERDNVE